MTEKIQMKIVMYYEKMWREGFHAADVYRFRNPDLDSELTRQAIEHSRKLLANIQKEDYGV